MIRFLQTPGPTKKIVLGGLLLIICAAMVITLVPGGVGTSFGFGAPGKGVVANIAGEEVTTLEVQRQARQLLKQQLRGRQSAQASMLLPYFAQQAAERLISEKAVLAEAERLGLRASDEDVRDELQHGRYAAVFFPGGKFIGEDEYQARIQGADLTIPQFEQSVKNEILFSKLRNLVAGSASATDAEVRQQFEKQNSKIKFDYAVLKRDDILKNMQPTEAELKAFYERNKATYNNSIPEKRKIKYVVIETSKLEARTPVSQQDLTSYYDQHRDEYRVPEQIDVRQILIKTPLPGGDGKVDPKGLDEARKKAEDVLKQLKAGAKFEDLARKFSEDPSGKNGGSVGWLRRGALPAEVEKVAFSLPKGGTSDVINAGYAFVIIHVDDKQAAHVKSLDEVKGEIEPVIKQQKASRAAENAANTLVTQSRTSGLDKAAAAKGFEVVTTDFLARTDSLPGLGNATQLIEAVFNAADKAPPDATQVPQGFAVFQVLEIKPPSTPTFEQIRSRVESEFKNERAAALLSNKVRELSDRAKAEHDLKKAAKELGATVKSSDYVLPDGQVPDIGSMSGSASVAFGMKPGEISGPIAASTSGIVLALVDKQEPSAQDFEAKKDQIRDSLMQQKQEQIFNMFVANLRSQMQKSGKIKINQDELRTLTRAQTEEGE